MSIECMSIKYIVYVSMHTRHVVYKAKESNQDHIRNQTRIGLMWLGESNLARNSASILAPKSQPESQPESRFFAIVDSPYSWGKSLRPERTAGHRAARVARRADAVEHAHHFRDEDVSLLVRRVLHASSTRCQHICSA
jgi:hypothetical protein